MLNSSEHKLWCAPRLHLRASVVPDLPNCLYNSKVILFADDTTLYASSDNIVNLYDLINRDLDNLTDWFRANKLSLNTSKTRYMGGWMGGSRIRYSIKKSAYS